MTDRHITHHFEEQVHAIGTRAAVRSGADALTYRELDAHANGVSERLRDLRAGAGTRVALLTDQDPRGCAALIGILKSGATCVPVSQNEPTDRIGQILKDSGARVVVTQRSYMDRVAGRSSRDIQVLDLHDVAPATVRRFALPGTNELTFILYTSGSTGTPKGVLQTSKVSLARTRVWQTALRIAASDRLTLFATFATGQGSSTTLLALLSGATLCPFKVREEGLARLTAWLRDQRITVYISSTTLLRGLAKDLDPDGRYPDLRLVRFGGERVTPHDIDLAQSRFPEAELIHTYSSTETGNIAMCRIPHDARFAEHGVVPVGRPREGAHVHIVSEDGRDLPQGEIGEVVVRGPTLSPGYWNDPVRTAETFRPLSIAPAEPACRTGDLGRIRPDGLVEHHGRRDFRVKIRGYRIELEEVEGVISRHPLVAHVAAAAKPLGDGVDIALVAYIQTVAEVALTPEAIRAYLATRLPDYMVPSMFVFLEDFPLTPSGKIDRKALPEPSMQGPTLSHAHVAPRSPLESCIANVWKAVLNLNVVGVDDHFLEVGGDSLRATQVAARLRDILKLEIPMRTLFEASTVSELATAIRRDPDYNG